MQNLGLDEQRHRLDTVKHAAPYCLTLVLGIFVVILGVFLTEHIAFFNTNWDQFMNNWEFYVSLVAFLLCWGSFYFLSKRFMHAKVKIFPLCLASVVFISNIVAIFCCKDTETFLMMENRGTVEVTYELSQRIQDIFIFGVSCLLAYTLIAIFPQVIRNPRSLAIIYYAIVVTALVAIVFSLFKETDYYMAYFDMQPGKAPPSDIKSFTNNENTFATILLFGMIGVGYLQTMHQHVWNYVLLHIFFVWMCFLQSLTGVLLAIFFLVIFLLYRFLHCLNEHVPSHVLGILVYASIIAGSIAFFHSGFLPVSNPLYKFIDHVESVIRSFAEERITFHGRVQIWSAIFANYNGPTTIIFGKGEWHTLYIISAICQHNGPIYWAHNGYIQLLFSGGIIRFAAFFAFIVCIVYLIFDSIIRRYSSLGAICLIALTVYLTHGIVESTAFFIADTKSPFGLIYICLPLLIEHEQAKFPEITKRQREMAYLPRFSFSFSPNPSYQAAIGSVISSLVIIFPVVVFSVQRANTPYLGALLATPAHYVAILAWPIVFAAYLYFGAQLEKNKQTPYYVFFGIGLALIVVLATLTLTSVISSTAFLIFELMIMSCYVLAVVATIAMNSVKVSLSFIRVLLDFLILNGSWIALTETHRLFDFDAQYVAVAFGGCYLCCFLLAFLIVTSRQNFMAKLRLNYLMEEVSVHRYLYFYYAKQEAKAEAYRMGMKAVKRGKQYYFI